MMTREEAIAVLEESKRQNEIMKDNPTTFWASYQIADGIKNTKRRIDALDAALSALRPVSREQVEKVWRGEWKGVPKLGVYDMACSKCGYSPGIRFYSSGFCLNCGAPMTDEAVEMVMEKWKDVLNEH